jgi:hypothetical protein
MDLKELFKNKSKKGSTSSKKKITTQESTTEREEGINPYLNGDLSVLDAHGRPSGNCSPEQVVVTLQNNMYNVSVNDMNKKGDEMTKLQLIKFAIEDWGLTTKTHGITNIFRLDSRLLRFIWLLCFLASTIYCIMAVTQILMDYYKYEVFINQQVKNEALIDFPAGIQK